MLLSTDEKKLFCKRKREKRKSSPRAACLLRQKAHGIKDGASPGLVRRCSAGECLCRKFLAYLSGSYRCRHELDFRIGPVRYKTGLTVYKHAVAHRTGIPDPSISSGLCDAGKWPIELMQQKGASQEVMLWNTGAGQINLFLI